MNSIIHVSDEEIINELEKMGYTGIPHELLKKFKSDLLDLIQADNESFSLSTISPDPSSTIQSQKTSVNSQSCPHTCKPVDKKHSLQKSPHSQSATKSQTTTSRSNSGKRILKRKTFRYKDGEPLVYQESYISSVSSECDFEEAPSILQGNHTPGPLPLYSKKRSNSTGNLNEIGKAKHRTLPKLPLIAYGSKSCDPVTRYHQYRQYWEAMESQKEKSEKALRWSIREQMMEFDPIIQLSLKQMPNIFKLPLEKRRTLSRWKSCSSLSK